LRSAVGFGGLVRDVRGFTGGGSWYHGGASRVPGPGPRDRGAPPRLTARSSARAERARVRDVHLADIDRGAACAVVGLRSATCPLW